MKKLTLVRQSSNNECGLACIMMIANYFEFYEGINYYRDIYHIGRDGISLKRMIEIFSSIGIKSRIFKSDTFSSNSFSKEPSIVYLTQNHFVVVTKNTGNNELLVYDPATGLRKEKVQNFQNQFGGYILRPEKDENFKKSTRKIKEYRHLIPIVKSVLTTISLVLVFSILAYLISILIPLIMQNVLNRIAGSELVTGYSVFGLISLAVILFYGVSRVKNFFVIRLQEQLIERLSFKTILHLFRINYSYFDNRSQGDVLFRVNVINQFKNAISMDLVQFIMAFTSSLVVFIFLIIKYPYLLLPLFLSTGLFFIVLSKQHEKISSVKSKELALSSKVEALTTEIIGNIFQLRISNLSNFFFKNYKIQFHNYKNQIVIAQRVSQNASLFIICILTFLPIYFIIGISMTHQVSVGELFALYSFLNTFFNQIQNLILSFFSYSILKSSFFYLNDLLDEKEMINDGKIEMHNFETLSINDVDFSYNYTDINNLNKINISINKGEKVALIGSSGCGKTTIIKLISRLYQIQQGSIQMNGVDIGEISKNSFSELISIIPQTPMYLNKTVRENLIMNNQKISEDEIIEVLKNAEIFDDIESLPMGLNTHISQISNFSGGQMQRLNIARELLKKPSLLVLDEATSNLDSVTERKVLDNLKKAKISQLIITHRLDSILDADRIYVLDNGEIKESGNHQELLKKKGLYTDFYLVNKNRGE